MKPLQVAKLIQMKIYVLMPRHKENVQFCKKLEFRTELCQKYTPRHKAVAASYSASQDLD